MTDHQLFKIVNEILARGNNVEIRRKPGGEIAVYEVKKNIVLR